MKNLQKPNPNHWINIFQWVQYEFKTSRHYLGVLLIAAGLSLLAVYGLWQTAASTSIGALNGALGFATVVISVFWLTLARGVEKPWEPNLFSKLGILGLRTYSIELYQLFQNHLIWSGIEAIFKFFRFEGSIAVTVSITVAAAIAVAHALAVSGTVVFTFSVAIAITFAFAFTIAVPVAISFVAAFIASFIIATAVAVAYNPVVTFFAASAVTLTVAGAFAFAFARPSAIAGAFIGSMTGAGVLALTGTGAFAFAGTTTGASVSTAYSLGILAGLGISSWHRLQAEPEQKWYKFFALLALPWFCTAPIVLSFAWIGLTTVVKPLTVLPLLPWQSAGLLELLLVGGSRWLWWWGQRREAMARNPLQGGLIEKTLRAQYGRPRR